MPTANALFNIPRQNTNPLLEYPVEFTHSFHTNDSLAYPTPFTCGITAQITIVITTPAIIRNPPTDSIIGSALFMNSTMKQHIQVKRR